LGYAKRFLRVAVCKTTGTSSAAAQNAGTKSRHTRGDGRKKPMSDASDKRVRAVIAHLATAAGISINYALDAILPRASPTTNKSRPTRAASRF
jgi:hypothetical protein